MTPEQNKNEIEYRISKWIMFNLWKSGLITETEMDACIKELLASLNPPTKSIECVEGVGIHHEKDYKVRAY